MARWQYQSKTEPISTDHESILVDKWISVYPSRLDPAKRSFWSGDYTKDNRPILLLDNWIPVYPSQISNRQPTPQAYLVDPYLSHLPPSELITLDKWSPSYPSRLNHRLIPFWSGHYSIDADFSHVPLPVIISTANSPSIIVGFNPMGQHGPTLGGGF
jgi:hypothetical protein